MFLAIPTIAILKVIFDRIKSFQPLGLLMGDDLPKTHEWRRLKLPSFDAGSTDNTGNLKNDSSAEVAIQENSNTNKT
ncbi:MAG: hypothetical protein H0W84_01105 [Bacteroidetes bacterium]|nr:hypothetical protein [Bacteroidota bacterium]